MSEQIPSIDEEPNQESTQESYNESQAEEETIINEAQSEDVQTLQLSDEIEDNKKQSVHITDAEEQITNLEDDAEKRLESSPAPEEAVELGEELGEVEGDKANEEPELKETSDKEIKEEEVALLEGEKMIAETKNLHIIEEADTEIEEPARHIIIPEQEASHISLHVEDLPEIRGLADLEYDSGDDSLKDVTLDEMTYLSRRRSIRASMAVRLYSEAGEDMAQRKKARRREIISKIRKGEQDATKEIEESYAEEEIIYLTRDEFYILHEKAISELATLRIKNKFLHRKMADHFKKRKMEHVLKEELDVPPEAIQKYEKKLDRLQEISERYEDETTRINSELGALENEKKEKFGMRQNLLLQAKNREREIGIGLISTKTGKELPEKVVDQLIRRQIIAATQISDLRLKFIRKRDELAEKTAELKALDNIGDDLSLMDYEQLKIENRAHSDKLEEREEELTKLRKKCRNAVQIMAHVREKSAALDADMDVLKEEYEDVHSEYIGIREHLNYYKTERDVIRNKTMKLKAESGLLTKPKLLIDMETSIEEAKLYEKTLEKVKEEYNLKTQHIRNLRKNIAYEMLMNRKPAKEKKKSSKPKFFKARPTLVNPKLPKDIFHKLENIMLDNQQKRK